MELTQKEVVVIKAAIKSRNKNKLLQPVLFALLIVATLTMLLGLVSGAEFTYMAMVLLVITIIQPQLGGSPKYTELVDILERQLPSKPIMEEVASQELKKT